jgi:O-antigen/teichoic acid export membrane protein
LQLLSKISFYKLVNLGLRAGGMGAKFLVAILLSKYYGDSDYKNYTLITTSITIAIYILGADFYNYSIRDILINTKQGKVNDKLLSTVVLYLFIYLLFIMFGSIGLNQLSYIKPYLWLIVFLGITEHLSQEIYRLLIAFKHVLRANLILAFRTVSWVLIIIYKLINNEIILIEDLLLYWLLANTLSLIYVLLYVLSFYFQNMFSSRLDFVWIKKGLQVAAVFFIGTVLLKIIEYANRYIIDYFLDDHFVGIYGFYSSLAIIITVYINTIVISFELPPLIAATNTREITNKYNQFKKSLLKQLIVVVSILLILIFPLLKWQNKISYIHYFPIFIVLIIGVVLMNYSLAEHAKLYILHKDKMILKILIFSSIISFVSSVILTALFGIYGTSFSFLIAGLTMYILRIKAASKHKLI